MFDILRITIFWYHKLTENMDIMVLSCSKSKKKDVK